MQPSYSYLAFELPLLLLMFGVAATGLVVTRDRLALWVGSWLLLSATVARAWIGSLAAREKLGLGGPTDFGMSWAEVVRLADILLLAGTASLGLFLVAQAVLARSPRARLWGHRFLAIFRRRR